MTERKLHKDEAAFHSKLIKFLQYNHHLFPKSFLFETKIVRRKDKYFNFNELSAKEEGLLLQAKHKTIVQTHSDYGGMGTNCDGSVVSGAGYIFLQWFTVPENKTFYCIDIEDLIRERDYSKHKTLKKERVELIGTPYELYKIYP